MNEKLKKLTSKNPKDFEQAAFSLVNNSDEELFAELVNSDDFLFDFVKQNVARRLASVCNEKNYLNLLNFLKYYSPSYDDVIVSNLARFADEDLTDRMLEIFENGTEDEKAYCAKFFSYIQDPLALEFLKKYAWSDNSYLSGNCAQTLAAFKDTESYNRALDMLKSEDEFTKLDGVKFLCAYGDKNTVEKIIETAKSSSMTENIAGELLYLTDLQTIYSQNKADALYILNSIINGLGEILPIGSVFDYELYNFLETVIKDAAPHSAVVLLNAAGKFNTLTENDEYLFDETKDTKQEVNDIKQLLNMVDRNALSIAIDEELTPNSLFVFTAIEFTQNTEKVRELLLADNPALVIKALEVLKQSGKIEFSDRQTALENIDDNVLKNIISAI